MGSHLDGGAATATGAGQTKADLAEYGDVPMPRHLLDAGLYPHLLFLLSDPEFLAAKLAAANPDDLLADLRAAETAIPDSLGTRVPAAQVEALRDQVADNRRVFSREGLKFVSWDATSEPHGFWRRYAYATGRQGPLAE